MENTITVATSNGDVVVHKLALGDYAKVLKSLRQLPASFAEMFKDSKENDLKDNSYVLTALPSVIGDSLPEFAEIIAIATDKDADFILQGDLADAMDITAAVLELNDMHRIIGTVKKMQARMKTKAQPADHSQ